MTWTQNYTPLGNLYLSALVAALPVIVLLGSLAFFHVKAHVAALLGLFTALLVAFFVYHMPGQLAVAAAFNGALFGILPIGWIVLNAIFIYDISVQTGVIGGSRSSSSASPSVPSSREHRDSERRWRSAARC